MKGQIHYYMSFFCMIWSLTLLPGSPRAPSFPWEQTGSVVLSSLLGNSLNLIIKGPVMESRSYWPAASRMNTFHLISLTFSPVAPMGPGKPWWQMERLINETIFAFKVGNIKQKGALMPLANTTWQYVTHSQPCCSCEAWLPWVPLEDNNIIQIAGQNSTKRKGFQQVNSFI